MDSRDQLITKLFEKYLQGSISKTELDELLNYFGLREHSLLLKQLILDRFDLQIHPSVTQEKIGTLVTKLDNTVLSLVRSKHKSAVRRKVTGWLLVALLVLTGSISFIVWKSGRKISMGIEAAASILPAANLATITIDGVETIQLSKSESVLVNKSGTIGYGTGTPILVIDTVRWISIVTPRAGQYRIILDDGTRIWLNADSRVKYPSKFEGEERRIFAEGEVYLEVAQNQEIKKFNVETTGQIIQVLGTKFNIRTYADAAIQSVTLLEGAVNVKNKNTKNVYQLKSGQQLRTSSSGNSNVVHVDAEDYTAWTEELIVLNNLNLREVTEELERWYDVKFDPVPFVLGRKKVFGSLKRNLPLRDVLRALENSYNIRFSVSERRVSIEKRT